jgi:O-antigen ligase
MIDSIYEQAQSLKPDCGLEETAPRARARRTPALLVGVATLTLFFVAQILQLFPALEGLQVAKLTALLVVILFLASREGLASRVGILAVPQLRYIIGVLLLALATVPFSVWPSSSLSYITDVFIKNIVFVYLLVQAVRTDHAARLVAGALIAGCSAIVIAMLTGFGPLVTYEREARVSVGGTYDPNDLALLFVVALPFAFFMLKGSGAITRLLLISAIALILLGIVSTGSRGGFLALLAVGGLILLRSSRQARKYALVTVGVGVVLFVFAAPPAYWERIGTILNYEEDYNMTDKGGRMMIWQTGLDMIIARPLTGVGISSFPIAHVKFSPYKLMASPHNTIIQITAELGIGGLILFTLIVFSSLRVARAARKEALREEACQEEPCRDLLWLASAVEVSLSGFLVGAFFLTHAYSPIFCFLAGISGALFIRCKMGRRQQGPAAQEIEYA